MMKTHYNLDPLDLTKNKPQRNLRIKTQNNLLKPSDSNMVNISNSFSEDHKYDKTDVESSAGAHANEFLILIFE